VIARWTGNVERPAGAGGNATDDDGAIHGGTAPADHPV